MQPLGIHYAVIYDRLTRAAPLVKTEGPPRGWSLQRALSVELSWYCYYSGKRCLFVPVGKKLVLKKLGNDDRARVGATRGARLHANHLPGRRRGSCPHF